MPLVLQLWMFATPVLYPLSAVPLRFRDAYALNPMVSITESLRQVMLYANTPDLVMLGRSAVISILLLVGSYVYFKRIEATMADTI